MEHHIFIRRRGLRLHATFPNTCVPHLHHPSYIFSYTKILDMSDTRNCFLSLPEGVLLSFPFLSTVVFCVVSHRTHYLARQGKETRVVTRSLLWWINACPSDISSLRRWSLFALSEWVRNRTLRVFLQLGLPALAVKSTRKTSCTLSCPLTTFWLFCHHQVLENHSGHLFTSHDVHLHASMHDTKYIPPGFVRRRRPR